MKICFKCGEAKKRSAFYAHPQMADGLLGKCKECAKSDVRKNRSIKAEYYREFDRKRSSLAHRVQARLEYQNTERGKEKANRAKEEWNQRNATKKSAADMVNNAVRDGRLEKFPCEVCGSKIRIHGHHDDYSKPLDVRWLCPKHHSEHHKALREAQKRHV